MTKSTKFLMILIVINILTINYTIANYLVSGVVFLQKQTVFDNIQIDFERVAPKTGSYRAFTDNSGNYSINLDEGIYNITISKDGYNQIFIEEFNIYNDLTIQTYTLSKPGGLCGTLSGILEKGSYVVSCDIEVPQDDTLIIKPGVNLLFKEDVQFEVYGLILAQGTETEKIAFTRSEDGIRWGGLIFREGANNNSIIAHSVIEYCNRSALLVDGSSPTISKSVIRNNIVDLPIKMMLEGEIIESNYGGGAGVYLNNSKSRLENVEIINNQVVELDGNKGTRYGAVGVYIDGGGPKIISCNISNNSFKGTLSGEYGGSAIFAAVSQGFEITNTIISKNINQYYTIEDIYSSNYSIRNSTIANNVSNFGLIRVGTNSDCKVYNSIFSNNQADNAHDIYNFVNLENFKGKYNCFDTEFQGANNYFGRKVTVNENNDSCDAYYNIFLNPQFVNPENQNYCLQPSSPCIDAGINDSVDFEYDFLGKQRIYDGNNNDTGFVDLGAYEYNAIPIPVISYNTKDETTQGASDGEIDITISNGTPPYEVSWSTGDTIEDLTGLSEGIYSITVVDAEQQEAMESIEIFCDSPYLDTLLYISGNVSTDSNYVTDATVIAFMITDSAILPTSYCNVSNDGTYKLQNLNKEAYIIYAVPGPSIQNDYLPTYYVNKTAWQAADSIKLTGNRFDVNITLTRINEPVNGIASINGYVVYEDSINSYDKEIYTNNWFNTDEPTSYNDSILNAAQNISILLLKDDNIVSYQLSDKYGHFSFTNLENGSYRLKAEKAGYEMAYQADFVLSNDVQEIENVKVIIREKDIVANIFQNISNNDINVYPNPAKNNITIDLKTTDNRFITIYFYNAAGVLVKQKVLNMPQITTKLNLNLSDLKDGIYYLKVVGDFGCVHKKVIKK